MAIDPVSLGIYMGIAQAGLSVAGSLFSQSQAKEADRARQRQITEIENAQIEELSTQFNAFLGSYRAAVANSGIALSSASVRASEASGAAQAGRGVSNTRLQSLFDREASAASTRTSPLAVFLPAVQSGIAGGLSGVQLGMALEGR